MKKIYFTAECKISDKLYKHIKKDPRLIWDTNNAIGMIQGYPILITGARLKQGEAGK